MKQRRATPPPDVDIKRFRGGHPNCIGYARVSTREQNLDAQFDALERAGCCQVYSEKVSGAAAHRPAYAAMMGALRKGDTVVVAALDRLGRKLTELVNTLDLLAQTGVHIRDLRSGIDTRAPHGKLMLHLLMVLAEAEREMNGDRTRAALTAASERGRKGGRPRLITAVKERQIEHLRKENFSLREIADAVALSESTVRRALAANPQPDPRQLELPVNRSARGGR